MFDGANRRVRGLWLRNGTYYCNATVKDPSSGIKKKRRICLKGASNLPAAKEQMVLLKINLRENGTVTGSKGMTLKEYIPHYLKHAKKEPKTLQNEKSFLKQWESYLGSNTRVTEITATQIIAYRTHCEKKQPKPLSNRTINLHCRALKQLLLDAKRQGYLKSLPTEGITQLKEKRDEKPLFTLDQICSLGTEALSNHPKTGLQFANWLALACYSGGRLTETLKLKWSDVDWIQNQLVFRATNTKSAKTRRVDFNKNLNNHLLAMLASKKPDSEHLFPSCRTANPTSTFKKLLFQIREKLNLKQFSPHSTRHFYISHCVMSGIDYLTISRWVGHATSILIAKIYGHLNNEHLKRQAEKLTF